MRFNYQPHSWTRGTIPFPTVWELTGAYQRQMEEVEQHSEKTTATGSAGG